MGFVPTILQNYRILRACIRNAPPAQRRHRLIFLCASVVGDKSFIRIAFCLPQLPVSLAVISSLVAASLLCEIREICDSFYAVARLPGNIMPSQPRPGV